MSNAFNDWNAKTLFHRFAILAVSLVITTGTAISPALPAMEKYFSNYPSTLVDMIVTIQQIPAFIVLMMSAQLAMRFGIKKIINIGILLMGVSGLIPAFILNIWAILGSRIIFGIGIGLINSLAITIINIFYDDGDQAQMLGNRASFETIGLCIVNIVVGLLLNISWQVAFLSYFFILAILVLFWKVVPNIPTPQSQSNNGEKVHETVNLKVIWASLFCALMTTALGAVSVLTPNIVVGNHLGTATESSFIITIFSISSMVMGFMFGGIFKLVKRFVLPLGLLFMVVGTLLMNFSNSIWMLIIAVIIIGWSYPLAGTYMFNLMGEVAPKNSTALANSMLLIGCNIGTAICPITIKLLGKANILGGNEPGIGTYAILVTVLLIGIIIYQIKNNKKTLAK